jgi:hypothetical protein
MAQAEKGRINDAGYAILYALPCLPLLKICGAMSFVPLQLYA